MSTSYQFDLLRTYRYLRLAMVLLVLLLFLSVAMYIGSDRGHMLQSISASYYTPVRAVFVSALCAIGTCLIVYQGNTDVEDVLLNGSGFFAFIVGFVPTRPEAQCVASRIPLDVRDAISNNVTALMVVAVIAFAVVMGVQVFATPASERALSKGAGAALAFSVLAFLGLAGFYVVNRGAFMCHGHDTAAILLFIGIVGVVFVSGRGLARKQARELGGSVRSHLWNRYFWGFVLMVASIAVIVVAGPWQGWLDHWVFWLEAALITQFATFWLTQTIELWREPRREDAPVSGA
ncbi:hypothetical protein SAMN04489867_2596 [Pedococcus dokdonensis]|uniref:Frag1/DRAM/Sfk1 family protein n=1 Tax=Pedococcus dokdonensis TaxID=443156 RepID=A0A1H0T2M1_9MICO|nr:hypothetical protein [Pedococcus dokdonensis]SDP47798.1 hypothetical protein SAMN04489867_2596 [Pedococcus dokdonensis]